MSENTVDTQEEVVVVVEVGACETAMNAYVETFKAMVDNAKAFDVNEFDKKSSFTDNYKTLRDGVQATRKSLTAFYKMIGETGKELKEGYEGTPEERLKKMEDREAALKAKIAKARKDLTK